jgi:hypothetical protein
VAVPNVQWKTPDDEQRNCPKHVEFRTRDSASVGFIVKKSVTNSDLTLLTNLVPCSNGNGGRKICDDLRVEHMDERMT